MSVPEGGIKDVALRLSASAVSLLRTRVELASVELAEERERLKASIALIAVAILAFGFAAVVATFGVIAWFWDSYRYAAIVIVALLYAIVGIAALRRQSALRKAAPTPFTASIDALRKDVEWLRSHHQGDRPPGS
ncbi:MAG TPA: phage holin family protein [Casimicrobiaceae bacterium]|nr:phage holin family protein [Casimicrobiaceae bacterium]